MLTPAGLYDNKVGGVPEHDALEMVGCTPEEVRNKPELLLVTNVGRIASVFDGLIIPLLPPFNMFVLARIFAARRLFTNGILQLLDALDGFGT